MNKVVVPVLALATLGAGAFAFMQMNRAAELDAELSAARASMEKIEGELKAARSSAGDLADLRANIERLKKERDEALARSKEVAASTGTSASPTGGGAPAGQAGDMRALMQGFAKQMDDPEVRKTMKAGQEQMIARQYEAIFKKLNLSEDEAKLVGELLASRNFEAMDKGRKLLTGKTDDASLKAARQEILQTKAETDAKLKGMLGEEKFGELTTFEQTAGDQRALDSLARSFEGKQMALQPEQKDALATIMREERLKVPGDEIPEMGGRGPGMSVLLTDEEVKVRQQQEESYQAAVINRAGQAGLSPDQVNGLKKSFSDRNQQRAMGRVMGRAFLGGGAGGR